jgi:DNA-binding transcriptional ArsR family regulator
MAPAATKPDSITGPDWLTALKAARLLGAMKLRTQVVAMHLAFALPAGFGAVPIGPVAESAGMTRRSVGRALHDLKRAGVIELRERGGVAHAVRLCKPCRGH